MLGTTIRLVVAALSLPFLFFPFVNVVVFPVFVWALVSAVRRIWRKGSPSRVVVT